MAQKHKVYVYSSTEKVTDLCFGPRDDLGRLVLDCDIDDPKKMVNTLLRMDEIYGEITKVSNLHLRYATDAFGVIICINSYLLHDVPDEFQFTMHKY